MAYRPVSQKKDKKTGVTTSVVEVERPEGKRYYKGEAKKQSTQLARNASLKRALAKSEETPADSLAGYDPEIGESKKDKKKKKKKKFGIFKEGGKVEASSNSNNQYGWPTRDARDGGQK